MRITIDGQEFGLWPIYNAGESEVTYGLRPITPSTIEDKPKLCDCGFPQSSPPHKHSKPEANKVEWVVISKSDHDITIELKTLIGDHQRFAIREAVEATMKFVTEPSDGRLYPEYLWKALDSAHKTLKEQK